MTEQLAAVFNSAVGMLPMFAGTLVGTVHRDHRLPTRPPATPGSAGSGAATPTGRRCSAPGIHGGNFGQLAGAAEVSMSTLDARVPIGGLYGDITYPVTSPLAITMGFAASRSGAGQLRRRHGGLDGGQATGAEHLVAWAQGGDLRRGRTLDRRDRRGARPPGSWPDKFLAGAAGVAHGVAAANLGLFTEAERRLTEANDSPAGEACARAIAWYLAMTRRSQGNEDAARGAAGMAADHPSGVRKLLRRLRIRLTAWRRPRPNRSPRRTDPVGSGAPWSPTHSGREKLLAEAQAELDRQIGLTRVKDQIETYRAATQMARVRAARGHEGRAASKHMIFTGPPGYRQDHDRAGGGQHPGRAWCHRRTETRRDLAQGFRRRVRGAVGGQDRQDDRPGPGRRAVHRRGLRAGAGTRRAHRPVRHKRRWTPCWPGWRTTATGWW